MSLDSATIPSYIVISVHVENDVVFQYEQSQYAPKYKVNHTLPAGDYEVTMAAAFMSGFSDRDDPGTYQSVAESKDFTDIGFECSVRLYQVSNLTFPSFATVNQGLRVSLKPSKRFGLRFRQIVDGSVANFSTRY